MRWGSSGEELRPVKRFSLMNSLHDWREGELKVVCAAIAISTQTTDESHCSFEPVPSNHSFVRLSSSPSSAKEGKRKTAGGKRDERNFVVSSFPLSDELKSKQKTPSRTNHLWFRLTLTVKLDHHQWTHKKKLAENGEKSLDFDEMRIVSSTKKLLQANGIKFLLNCCSRDRAKRFYWLSRVNCWGNGAELLLCAYCVHCGSSKWNGNGGKIGIQAAAAAEFSGILLRLDKLC